jgi:tetratricopeptide (TPR) repeat protein
VRAALVAVALMCASAAAASAQVYPSATAPPRSTDKATLRSAALTREVHERFERGLAAEAAADWRAAVPEFERIIALDPGEPKGSTARYDLAIAHAHLGGYERAAALLQDALVRDPGFAAAAANLVSVELMAGNLAGARAAADRFVRIAPDAARSRYARGLIALREGDWATARSDFRVLLGNDPSYAIAHYDLAIVEIRAQRYDVARSELERALELAPRYARARFALGTLLLREGRRSDARGAFERASADASDSTLRDLATNLRDRL